MWSDWLVGRHDEVRTLQEAVDRITAEKHEIEKQLALQRETCRQLTQANNTLSARALTLAEEAANAPEKIRKELMAQLTECKAKLQEAQEELDAVRRSDQSQTEALLDELNSLQTDNGNLRAQLRAIKK
jgi:chromosome segregation ATPase